MQDATTLFLSAAGWQGLFGWAGSLLYLTNHAALSLVRSWPERTYLAVNLLAALMVAVASAALASWQSVGVNAFWAVVSFQALVGRAQNIDFLSETAVRYISLLVVLIGCLAALRAVPSGMEILGWASVFAFCGAYFLFANNKISQRIYFLYNGWAALLILPILWLDDNWPVFVLECCWAALSFGSYVRNRIRSAGD